MIGVLASCFNRLAIDRPSSPGSIRSRMTRSMSWARSTPVHLDAVGNRGDVVALLRQVRGDELSKFRVIVNDKQPRTLFDPLPCEGRAPRAPPLRAPRGAPLALPR